MSKAPSLFSRQRLRSPAAQRKFDIGLVVAGLIIASVLAVLTWINYQNHIEPIASGAAHGSIT